MADSGATNAALTVVEAEIVALDLACSRCREDSELSELNRSGGVPMALSPLLIEAIEVALGAARAVDGTVTTVAGWSWPEQAPR
jgi:FAD:protein FMN transferase